MKKSDVRKKVLDRAPTRYTKGIVTVLAKLVDLTYAPNLNDSIEGIYSAPKNVGKLATLANLHERSVRRAIAQLEADHLIVPNPTCEGSWRIDTDVLLKLDSKYKLTRNATLLEKIRKMLSIRAKRHPELVGDNDRTPTVKFHPEHSKTGCWNGIHHNRCTCEGTFCTHPVPNDGNTEELIAATVAA